MKIDNKTIIGLISFIIGIILITFSSTIPILTVPFNVIGALFIAYGVLNLIDLINDIVSNRKRIIGFVAFIIGILIIEFSETIPLPNILVNIIGALLMAYGVLNLVYSLSNN